MLKTLPSSALRTLESVVRLRGFGRAADELNVSQSAVSQHVKQLEDWLGHNLLVRKGRQTFPTEHGERLACAVRDGFGIVEAVCDDLRDASKPEKRGILVAAPPGFAFVWLLPRLLHFNEIHPDIQVSLSSDPKSYDPFSSDADVIISYSAGGFPSRHAELLMSESMAPVCTPQIAKTLNSLDDLAHHVILQDVVHNAEHQSNWTFWANETGITLPYFPQTQQYGQANMVIHAAEKGAGIAMGRGPLVQDALQRGALVEPFPERAVSQSSYWFVCEHGALRTKSVRAFHTWILGEAAAQEEMI